MADRVATDCEDARPAASRRRSAGLATQVIAFGVLAGVIVGPPLWGQGMLLALDTVIDSWLPWAAATPSPARNPLLSDVALQSLPWRHFMAESFSSGTWPLWNPYILGGHPSFGSVNEQVFYPFNILAAFVPAAQTFAVLAWCHLLVAGLGARAFARLHTGDDPAACLAGVAAMLGGPVLVWLEYPMFLDTIAWAGLLFYGLERTLRRDRAAFAVLAGLTLGLVLLAGMAQISLWLALLAAAYAGVRMLHTSFADRPALTGLVARLTVVTVIGGGLGALTYLPGIELLTQAHRAPLPANAFRGLPSSHLLTFVVPDAFGTPSRRDYAGALNFNEATVYVGTLPLFLCALLPLVGRQRSALALFAAAGCALVALAFDWRPLVTLVGVVPVVRYFALNRLAVLLPFVLGFVAAVAYARLPAIGARRLFRGGAAVVIAVGLAGVAWLGIDERRRHLMADGLPGWQDRWPFVVVALGLLVCLVGIWRPRSSRLRWLAPAALAVDLLVMGLGYNTSVLASPLLGPATPPLDRVARGPMAPRTVGLHTPEVLALAPNLGMLWDIPTPDGYVSEHIERYGTFVRRANPERTISWLAGDDNFLVFTQLRAPYLDLAGVRYVVAAPNPVVADTLRLARGADTGPIFGSRSAGAIFRARQNGLNRIDVFPIQRGTAPPWVALHLKASPDSPDHLSYIRIDGPRLAAGQPLTFYFNPIADSAGRQFYLYLDAPEAGPESAIALASNPAPAPTGEARIIDAQQSDGTLTFAAYGLPLVGWTRIGEANGVAVHENPVALGRAFVVSSVRLMSDDDFYDALDDGTFDPRTTAAVGRQPPLAFGSLVAVSTERIGTAVTITRADATAIGVHVALDRPGMLVVSNAWYPGWQARVDGIEAEIERVDATLQGVYLAAGAHAVELVFAPASLAWGLRTAALAMIVALSVLALDLSGRLKRRDRPPPPADATTRPPAALDPVA